MEEIPARDFQMLERYWAHEPWGAWRDNLHAAMIAMEIVRPNLKKGSQLSMEAFMVRHPEEIAEERETKRRAATGTLYKALKAMARSK